MTILELLYNVQINLIDGRNELCFAIGKQQLLNAIKQLEKNPDASKEVVVCRLNSVCPVCVSRVFRIRKKRLEKAIKKAAKDHPFSGKL